LYLGGLLLKGGEGKGRGKEGQKGEGGSSSFALRRKKVVGCCCTVVSNTQTN